MASDSISVLDFDKARKNRRLDSSYINRWWDESKFEDVEPASRNVAIAQSIEATINNMKQNQRERMRQLIISARLYGNSRLLGVTGLTPAAINTPPAVRERLTDNVIQSVIDTSTARVGEDKPRPYFLTDGGTWKEQRRAKTLNKASDGIFYECKSYALGSDAQRDAEVFGDGFIFVREKFERVHHERVLGAELWVDDAEGMYGNPRQLHWERPIDREELLGWFKDITDGAERKRVLYWIETVDRAPLMAEGYPPNNADMVTVRESWHLSSGPDSKDGMHCISIDGHLIEPLKEWKHPFFPFARWRWCTRPMGYWSQGLAEQLQNKQLEVNRLLWVIQESLRRAGTYKVLVEDGSKIVKEHLSNEIGAVVTYRGQKPEWFVPPAASIEHYEQYKNLVLSMYERAGVPLQVATGMKPVGLNSAPAQRAYRDATNEAMRTKQRLNGEAFVELAKISLAIAREIALRNGGFYETRVPVARTFQKVKISADDLDPNGWEPQCFLMSSLPKEPGARLQTVMEYVQARFLTLRQARRLADFPDIEAVESLANAAEDLIVKVLDEIADDGKYSTPEPTDDLALAKEIVVEYINRGRALGLEEERLDMLRTYSLQVDSLMAQAAPPPQALPSPGMPQLPPGPIAPPMPDAQPVMQG
jgi:hypothetical protein